MPQDHIYRFKILLLGDSGVGKSCLLLRFADHHYTDQFVSTVGIDFKTCHVEVAGKPVKLQVWDTAGAERFRSVLSSYYRGAHGVILVYDTTQRRTYLHVERWLEEIRYHIGDDVNVMLVGNKCDAYSGRKVSQHNAVIYAQQLGIPFMESSAKSGLNVENVFTIMAVNIFKRLVPQRAFEDRIVEQDKDSLWTTEKCERAPSTASVQLKAKKEDRQEEREKLGQFGCC